MDVSDAQTEKVFNGKIISGVASMVRSKFSVFVTHPWAPVAIKES